MNCLDFRRRVLADPRRPDGEGLAHAAQCPACRAFAERQAELDNRLYDAMRVPVPDGLADRVLVAQGLRRRRTPWLWAMAATVLLASGIAYLVPAGLAGERLAREAVMHAAEEPESFRTRRDMPSGFLQAALGEQGLRLAGPVGEVTYSRLCPLSGSTARHLVIATPGGPVTLFLLPQDDRRRRRSEIEAGRMTAIVMPAGRGSIAIVADNPEIARGVERALVQA
jgi:hypothetical protein